MASLDHVGIRVHDFEKSVAFYTAALGALGIKCLMNFAHEGSHHAGFGVDLPFFWISASKKASGGTHVAFTAKSRAEVEAFYAIAVSTGGRDNGEPGLRPQYHPNYYGAFVFDPDANNIEAVCHDRT